MGCQCNKKNEEEELNKEPENKDNENENDYMENAGDLQNQDGANKNQNTNHQNEQEDEDYLEKLNEEKNAKYAEYPDKMVEIINKIRENPVAYADFIEDSIKYITEIPDKEDETKTK